MAKRIAIAVIHGMGSQGDTPPAEKKLTFSRDLYYGLRRYVGGDAMTRITWREIFWSDILQKRQDGYLAALKADGARWCDLRDFVGHRLADAGSYRRVHYPNAYARDGRGPDICFDTYTRVHARVARCLRRLEAVNGPDTPLIVIAHSLGARIMSNYIHDTTRGTPVFHAKSGFQRFETMTSFITFGSNIPVFSFHVPRKDINPIEFPGRRVWGAVTKPWWINLNDPDDVLGMPLAPSAPAYQDMVGRRELQEEWCEVGSGVLGASPFSHNAYWRDPLVVHRIGQQVHRAFSSEICPENQPFRR